MVKGIFSVEKKLLLETFNILNIESSFVVFVDVLIANELNH